MSLLNLWNALLGRSPEHTEESVKSVPAAPRVEPATALAPQPQAVTRPALSKPSLGLFGAKSPHSALLKKLRGIAATSVLEIGVGDGTRVIAVQQTLTGSNTEAGPALKHVAIDRFEMDGGQTSLMQFHQTLRQSSVRVQVYPEPIDRGLQRVAHTIGLMDLVIVDRPIVDWQTAEVLTLLSRVTHSASVIVFYDNERWQRFDLTAALSQQSSGPTKRAA